MKRRPGRPRGSKTKKKTQPAEGSASAPAPTPVPAPAPLPEVNAQNQQYYEFQWRVLNLCAEFYGAAEELLVSTVDEYAMLVSLQFRKRPLRWSSRNATRCHPRTLSTP